MHSIYFSILCSLLGEQGITERQLLQGTDMSLADIQANVSFDSAQLNTLFSNALELSAQPHLGLKVGSQIDLPSQGIFGYALMTSSTVGDALRLLVRYNRAILPSIQIELLQERNSLQVITQTEHLPTHLGRFYSELLYAAILASRHILSDVATTSFTLELDYPAPSEYGLYQKLFASRVRFNCARRALSFDQDSLALAISTANPLAQDLLQRECDRMLPRDNHRGIVTARVQRVLLQAGSEFPNCAAMAKKLHMSESTLQRQLAKEATKYQLQLDRVRYRLAGEYLVGTTLPVAEIAGLLGFSDAVNFRRSFRRWSGTTPSQIRERGRTETHY